MRRSIHSSYYAAYSAITHILTKHGVQFAHGWKNPDHNHVPRLILGNTTLPRSVRFEINKAIRRLRMWRENADYRPAVLIERRQVQDCIRDAMAVMDHLEIDNEQN